MGVSNSNSETNSVPRHLRRIAPSYYKTEQVLSYVNEQGLFSISEKIRKRLNIQPGDWLCVYIWKVNKDEPKTTLNPG